MEAAKELRKTLRGKGFVGENKKMGTGDRGSTKKNRNREGQSPGTKLNDWGRTMVKERNRMEHRPEKKIRQPEHV